MKSVSSGTLPVTERHTGDNISSWIEEMLRKFDISTQKIVSFIHDNGSNFIHAENLLTEKFEWSSESCAGHDLQLCINPLRTVVAYMRQGNKLDYHAQTNRYNFATHHPTNLKSLSFCSVYSAENSNILGQT